MKIETEEVLPVEQVSKVKPNGLPNENGDDLKEPEKGTEEEMLLEELEETEEPEDTILKNGSSNLSPISNGNSFASSPIPADNLSDVSEESITLRLSSPEEDDTPKDGKSINHWGFAKGEFRFSFSFIQLAFYSKVCLEST